MFVVIILSRKAVSLIETHETDKPLFLYLAYQSPHMDLALAPPKYQVDLVNCEAHFIVNSQDQYKGRKIYQNNVQSL